MKTDLNAGNTYKYIDQTSGKFYSIKKLLTYGKPWNFITGSRSVGKSTAIAVFFILDYVKNGHMFIYTRRTKDETLLTCRSFFGNAVNIINSKTDINIKELIYDAGCYYIDLGEGRQKCGTIVPLSLEQKYKSGDFSAYFNLVYDEFIARDASRYLGTKDTPEAEYNALISLYQTIDRGIDRPYRNETRFFFAANTMTVYNPIFLSVGISDYIESKAQYISPKNKLWVLQQVGSVEATEDMQDSFAYQLSDEFNRAYAYENRGVDTADYIKRPPEHGKRYVITLSYKGDEFGVWCDLSHDIYYIDTPRDIGCPALSLDVTGHKETDLMLITRWHDYPMIEMLAEKFKRSKLYFGTGKIKNTFLKYFKLMP